jgi:predicted phosphoribosyltransferase
MTPLFFDRHDAGRQLASRLHHFAGRTDLVVLGLPTGGVPVAAEVAAALGARLDIFVVRKLGVPGHEEFAMGAIASGGVRVLSQDVLRVLNLSREVVDAVAATEQGELDRCERDYRLGRPFPDLHGATVILVDDGVATGSTMLVAVHALRQHGPSAIIAAAPVMSEGARQMLSGVADRCEAVAVLEPFRAAAAWYRDFAQTTDDEVRGLLRGGTAVPSAVPPPDPTGDSSFQPRPECPKPGAKAVQRNPKVMQCF